MHPLPMYQRGNQNHHLLPHPLFSDYDPPPARRSYRDSIPKCLHLDNLRRLWCMTAAAPLAAHVALHFAARALVRVLENS